MKPPFPDVSVHPQTWTSHQCMADTVAVPDAVTIFSDNLALVLALCKGRSKKHHIASSHASYLCVWPLGRFRLMFQADTVRIELFRHGKSFFDCENDASKLFPVLAQLLRSSPSPTCDQNCFSPSLMDLDIGKADLTSHTHVPAMSVQSRHNRMISLSLHGTCCGCLISKFFFIKKKLHKGHICMGPLTWCGLPPGLFRTQFLDDSQIRCSSSGSGTKARHAQCLVNINKNCPNCLVSGHPPDINARREKDLSRSLQSVALCKLWRHDRNI